MVFKVQQYEVRKEIKTRIKQGVPIDELVRIEVTAHNAHELDWEHSREFRYRGTMYDVVRTQVVDAQTTVYYCVNDDQETELFAELDQLVQKSMEAEGKGRSKRTGPFKLLPCIVPGALAHPSTQILSIAPCIGGHSSYLRPWLPISSPPPEQA